MTTADRIAEIIAELDAWTVKYPGATIADALYETADRYRLREWNAVIRHLRDLGRVTTDDRGMIVATRNCSCCSQGMTLRVSLAASIAIMGDRSYAGAIECAYCRPFGPGAICCNS